MKKVSIASRLFALLLVLALVAGISPVINQAEVNAAQEDPVIVIAGSDFQSYKEVGGSKVTDHAAGATQVKGLLNVIKKDGHPEADGFLFVGDYDYEMDDSANGKKALQKAVQDVYGKNLDEVYVQGNHDPDSLVANGTLSASGAHDTEHYGVYVINEKEYDWGGEDEDATADAAYEMGKYLDAKVAEGYTKPIFVLCHIPLHYSMRTYKADEGDGLYAFYLFDELNEAGAAGLNIIFLFGHNHSGGWDDYLGGAAIYLAKGDKINICQGNQQKWEVETLNFTYMNAGYVSYYRNVNTGSECDLTMTVFAIYKDKVVIKRYSKDGIHNLKSKGVRNKYAADYFGPYWGTVETYSPNTKTYSSPQTIKLIDVDTTALKAAIAKGEAIQGDLYTQESYSTLQNALMAAKTILAKASATQDEVDAAVKTVNAALNALEEYKAPTNKNDLSKAIADAEALDADAYTAESYAVVTAALKTAKAVMQDADATQEEADAAATALSNAIDALKEKPVSTEPTEPETTEPKPTEPKPTEPEATEPKPTEPKPTEPNATEPTEDPNATEPTEDPNATEPTEDPNATEPTEDPNATEPTEDPNATEPTEDPNATEPTEDPNATEPTEDPNATEPEATKPANNETQAPTDAPATNNDAKEESKSNAGLIIGIIAAVVVIGAVAFFVIKKKK